MNLWFSDNGERAGTFNGHNGAVWTTDINCELLFLILVLINLQFFFENLILTYLSLYLFLQTTALCCFLVLEMPLLVCGT